MIAAADFAKSSVGYSAAIAIGVSTGTLIAPRHQWRLAVCVFAILAALFPAYAFIRGVIAGDTDAANLIELAGTALGVVIPYRLVQGRFAGEARR